MGASNSSSTSRLSSIQVGKHPGVCFAPCVCGNRGEACRWAHTGDWRFMASIWAPVSIYGCCNIGDKPYHQQRI
ncbi:hypothetical protein B0T21DRAFT_289515 [Apiosordaria backusii]|uniref:Uncharacterized protein n=1 Tax=Apiosordaria backusii TaxID=314023 RepID=A0AA40EHK0_9PEZI|nr:hypothetical protein B0T21DRAFT_289515 [Apiosordaria backusii]